MKKEEPVVYLFHNQETGHAYVGSAKHESIRYRDHMKGLKGNYHHNDNFQKTFNENPNFDYVSIPMNSRDEAFGLEQVIIDEFNGNPFFLNISKDARNCRPIMTDEIKEKLRIANIGKTLTDEHKYKAGSSFRGKQLPEEHRLKISESNRGKNLSEETREKLRQANLGKIQSDETKEKRRLSMLGKNLGNTHTDEAKERMRIAHTGKILSEEHKAKIRQASLGRIDTPETTARRKEVAMKRAVKVEADGVVYNSIREAAQAHGIQDSSIRDRVNSSSEKFESWRFLK